MNRLLPALVLLALVLLVLQLLTFRETKELAASMDELLAVTKRLEVQVSTSSGGWRAEVTRGLASLGDLVLQQRGQLDQVVTEAKAAQERADRLEAVLLRLLSDKGAQPQGGPGGR